MSVFERIAHALLALLRPNRAAASAPPVAAPPLVSGALLRRLGAVDPDGWAPILSAACTRHEITTPLRLAAFLANVLHETGGLRVLVENLNYSAERIREVWPSRFATVEAAQPFARQPEMLANKVYGGRMGNQAPDDGWLYRGRGLIQLTGRANYEAFARAIGVALDKLPTLLEAREGAADSAAHYWKARGCNPVADRGDIRAVRIMVNGGTVGLDEVERRYREAQGMRVADA